MLKITIDNEEVLSNKDFTIEEEMLNTPSVILDNVYPKSWETDKDYTSRFYHPNDYSKCLIKDEIYTPAEPGLNVEGTNFQITADTTKLNELTSIKGNTTQSSTPTPTAPVPVNVVSGRQDIVVAGKNLIPFSDIISTGGTTSNGITFTLQADGTIKANGTATAGVSIYLTTNYIEQKAGTYTLSDGIASGQSSTTFFLYADVRHLDETPWDIKYFSTFETTTRTRTIEEAFKFKPRIVIRQGQVLNDLIFKPQLEKGSTATEYEAYKGNTYNIDLPVENLLQNNLISGTKNGITYVVNEDKSITLNGTATAITWLVLNSSVTLEAGTYTMTSGYSGNDVRVYSTGLGTYTLDGQKTITKTTSVSGDVSINIPSGTICNNLTIKPMIEKSSKANTYTPYGTTPIELCKLGNYQDRIYKENGTWYLHKEIGKVVLNGSERGWGRSGASTSSVFVGALSLNQYGIGIYSKQGVASNWLTNRFSYGTLGNLNKFNVYNADTTWGYRNIAFGIDSSLVSDLASWRTWLGTHNTSVYYVLATPTTTEITDTELISQLESIELLEGLNNVSVVSPYLQGIINIHYNYVNETTTSDLLFCGVVKNSGNISLNPRYPHYQTLQILDFKTFLSEGETLDFVIANKTIEEAIDQIISTIAPYGFVKGNIQIIGADTIIGAYSTKDKTAYDVFNYIADITQSRWTTRLIDENTVAIDFYDPTLLPQGTPINYNETWFRDNLIDDMSYSYGSNDYRNKQVMTSNEVYGSILQTQTMVANGYQTQFDTELKIGQITSITANGTQLTIATNEQKELGFNADIYYTPGNNYFESADLRSTGEILIVNYIAIVEGRQIITNGTEINRVATATGRKGIVARYENRNDANTSNELQLIGQSYIRYKGTPEIKLTIVSRKNIWNIGDRVQFNAPINELATEYMVKKKTINRILANPSSEEHIVYTYEMTSSFNSEQAINYFDNQRAKAKGNIGESEYITRNVDIENIANIIFYGSNVEQATITGDNTLQATLSSPIIN